MRQHDDGRLKGARREGKTRIINRVCHLDSVPKEGKRGQGGLGFSWLWGEPLGPKIRELGKKTEEKAAKKKHHWHGESGLHRNSKGGGF